MAWGSNVTQMDFTLPVTKFDPQTWGDIGAAERGREYTMKVAEARKGVREKFAKDRETKLAQKVAEDKKVIQTQLDAVNNRLNEITNRLIEIATAENNQQNEATKANIAEDATINQQNMENAYNKAYNQGNAIMNAQTKQNDVSLFGGR